jgi:hypothetical protein
MALDPTEDTVTRSTMRALMWGTVLAALLSALLLGAEDTTLPELARGSAHALMLD